MYRKQHSLSLAECRRLEARVTELQETIKSDNDTFECKYGMKSTTYSFTILTCDKYIRTYVHIQISPHTNIRAMYEDSCVRTVCAN